MAWLNTCGPTCRRWRAPPVPPVPKHARNRPAGDRGDRGDRCGHRHFRALIGNQNLRAPPDAGCALRGASQMHERVFPQRRRVEDLDPRVAHGLSENRHVAEVGAGRQRARQFHCLAAQRGASVLRGLLFVPQGLLLVLLLLHQVVIVGVHTSCFTADILGTPTP